MDLVQGFTQNGAEHAGLFAEGFESAAVVVFVGNAVEFDEGGPGIVFGNGGWLVIGRLGGSWAILRNSRKVSCST